MAGGGIVRYFEQRGLSPAGAAGIAGNTMQESGDNPNAPGGGYFQDIGSRAPSGRGSGEQQLAAAWRELQGYPGLLRTLRTTRSPSEAARAFSEQFERPGIPMLSNRERYAREALGGAGGTQGAIGRSFTPGSPPHLEMGQGGAGQQADIAALAALLTQKQGAGGGYGGLLPKPGTGDEEQAGPRVAAEVSSPGKSSKLDEALALVSRIGEESPEANVVPGTPGSFSGSPNAQGYVNPHPGASLGRTDMGVDYTIAPGSPVRALGAGRVLGVGPNWYQGQPYLAYQLESGPEKGKIVYVAEGVNPTVKAGQRVRAGQTIATGTSQPTGIEEGWGSPQLETTEAAATTGYHEGEATKAGQSFRRFLEALGR
jgi:murein DD-endopeptidase MepM/ murein hydrolase activator NlpD